MITPPQLVPSKVCLTCQGCCRFSDPQTVWRPRITADEKKNILCHSKPAPEVIEDHNGYLITKPYEGGCSCRFFNPQDNTCQIYAHRPFECALYPILLVKQNDTIVVSVHLSCPYVIDHNDEKLFEDYIEKLKSYFTQEDVLRFVKNNRVGIGDYAGFEKEIQTLFVLDVS